MQTADALLQEQGVDDVLVTVGGTIPGVGRAA
jgi:methylmalonyl-CoA mutase cobalamin-binding subunit